MFGTFRFEKKEYAELAYQIWKNMKPDEHLMYTVRVYLDFLILIQNGQSSITGK